MSAQLMDGKALAAQKKAAIRAEVERLARTPGLAVVLVGENPASQIYVRGKARDCEECGIRCMDFRLPAQTTESELLTLIAELNGRADVDGILVQLPLPGIPDATRLIDRIDPRKDVDGFHPANIGHLRCASSACARARRAASSPCWRTPTSRCEDAMPPLSACPTTSAGRWRWSC